MNLFRLSTIIIVVAAMSAALAENCFAQDLSEASLSVGSERAHGYMGLGGNLGKVFVKRPRVRPVNSERRPPLRRHQRAGATTVFKPQNESPLYLISQSLDHTGMNIVVLRTQASGP